jgi:signal transduction histidine kinase
MPEGGIVHVRARNVELGPGHDLPLEPGRYLGIAVEDEGLGMSEEVRAKIFDPYFTTKAEGSGLGLATAYSIIRKPYRMEELSLVLDQVMKGRARSARR